jgi:hypothetical protein
VEDVQNSLDEQLTDQDRARKPVDLILCCLLGVIFISASMWAQEAAPFGVITGLVKSGNVPLPGVTVSAANTLTGKKYVTSTDVDGSFKLEVASRGRYVVRAEFFAFAPVTQEILITAENRNGHADLAMVLLSRAQRDAQQQQAGDQGNQLANAIAGLGMQRLSLAAGIGGDGTGTPAGGSPQDSASLANTGLPNAGLAAEGNTESVAVSGAMGRSEQPTFDPGEMQDRIAEMRDQAGRGGNFQGGGGPMMVMMGGGPGGFGGGFGGPGGFGGGRGFRNFNVNKPHGSIFYNYGGSALDARPYSLTGDPAEKASYSQNRFGATIGGPLNIPHLSHGGTKTFLFGSYTGTRATNPYDIFSTVPTLAERSGDFSQSPVAIFNPSTHTQFANNMIPAINPTAAGLLQFIPLPNLPGTSQNFHFVSANPTNTDTIALRFNHSFGSDPVGMFGAFGGRGGGGGRGRQQRQQQQQQQQQDQNGSNKPKQKSHWSQSINGGFSYNNIRNSLLNPFPGLGGQQSVHNYNANFGYSLNKGVFLNSLRFNWNHSGNNRLNHFTNQNNIEGQLGIAGVSPLPADFGLPSINLAPEFSSLQDLTPLFRNDQNYTISDSVTWTHGKHGWSWGGDFRHQLIDLSNASNARGSFVFTGFSTGGIGSDGKFHNGLPLADFLLGFAQETSIQFGAENYHFRSNAFNLYVQDNWRATKNLTLNLGLRYEYIAPFTEANNKLVNLDVAPGFSAVAPVQAGQTGPFTGKFSDGVINPDRNNFAPRLGIAWKPWSKTVVRAGYGVNYNLGQYATLATQLGFQPPFAFTETNPATSPTALTLQNGFPINNSAITNSFAVDRNYRLAYVQSWNLNIQQEVKSDLVINIGYTGSKGSHLDMVRAPSLDANGQPIADAQPFLFESSDGSSILHSGTLRVRKRMRHGLSMGGTYTYSKSIDNASSIGGGAVVVAQNDRDLAAERGLSSFDQRHRLTADYSYDLPLGKDRKWLNNGSWMAKAFGGFSFSGNLSVASGFPFSPRIFGNAADIRRGITGAHRPDIVPGQPIQSSDPSILHWFNTAAFTNPGGLFGDAGRNIIIGPHTVDVDMAFSKSIQVKEMQSLELRIAATNVFNHARFSSIDTTLGSPTFGQVISVGSMRKAQIVVRYRF